MNIKKVIKENGWTLEKLASEMTNKNGEKGISQASVSQLINGNPTLDKLHEIASIIGISVSELVKEGDEHLQSIKCPYCKKNFKFKLKLKIEND